MTTNVPVVTFGPRGFIAPAQSAVLVGIIQDINAAFGGGLNPALETSQGQIASSETAIVGDVNDTFVKFTNQVDPAFSDGRMQDAIGRIYFIARNPAQPTVVQALCSGFASVVIPVGALARSTDGNLYSCVDGGVISGAGNVTLAFACVVSGPIPCPEGALDQIYQAIPGWDSITNPSDGVVGDVVESRAAFEARRAASVAKNARGFLPAIEGSVLAIPDVLDAYTTENSTGSPVTIGNITLAVHSLYVAAVGGTDADVAQAIWVKKPPGCAYNGNTTVVVQDTNSGYSPPYPSYTVLFERPLSLPILFAVNLQNGPNVPSTYMADVQAAIIAAFSGADGGARARIGSIIYASRYNTPVALVGPWVQIISLQIGSNNTKSAAFTASIAAANMTVSAVASGTLAPGQTVDDATGHVAEGTKIISQSSGSTGSTGVYVVSIGQMVSSEAMVSAVPNLNTVQVGIDQAPTIVPENISVTLT